MHDVPEVYTGDIPAPFKWDHPSVAEGLHEAECAFEEQYLGDLLPVINSNERRLLKVADMLDLVLSSLEEVGRGNKYAKQLVHNGQRYLVDMGLPKDLMAKCEAMVVEVKALWQPTTSK